MVIDGGSGGRPKHGAKKPHAARIDQPQTVIRLPKDPYETDYPAPRPKRGRGVLALAVITIVVAAVIAINTSRHSKDGQGSIAGVGGGVPPATASSSAFDQVPTQFSQAPFPSQTAGGVLVGYQDTKEGSEAAAANYIAAYVSEPMVHPDKRHVMVHAIADPAIEPHLQSQLDSAFTAAAHGYGLDAKGNPPAGQTLVYRGVPAGVRVQSYTADKAVVDVWTCTIDGIAGQGSTNPVTATWNTLTVTLTWVNGDWRWNDFSQADGPTPVAGQQQSSSPDELQKAVQQFARLRYAP